MLEKDQMDAIKNAQKQLMQSVINAKKYREECFKATVKMINKRHGRNVIIMEGWDG